MAGKAFGNRAEDDGVGKGSERGDRIPKLPRPGNSTVRELIATFVKDTLGERSKRGLFHRVRPSGSCWRFSFFLPFGICMSDFTVYG